MNSLNHVAIIMDGNGRWGEKRNKSRNFGHKEGLKTVEKIIDQSIKRKINFLTLFAFSTENWKRPKNEVNYLFKLLENFLKTEFTITSSRDRMGIRLGHQGKKFDTKSGLNVLSEAIEIGDIQIDGQGVPTILLNDRQPTGRYPRIATVISADLHKVAQIGVNSTFKFTLVSLIEAIKALKDFTDELSDLENEVFNLTRDPSDIDNLLSYGLIDGAIRGDEYEES